MEKNFEKIGTFEVKNEEWMLCPIAQGVFPEKYPEFTHGSLYKTPDEGLKMLGLEIKQDAKILYLQLFFFIEEREETPGFPKKFEIKESPLNPIRTSWRENDPEKLKSLKSSFFEFLKANGL